MTSTYSWHESYKAALLETNGTKVRERIQAAEAKIRDRQRVLSEDHGGTPEERQAIADAIHGLKALLKESAEWPDPQVSDGASTTPD
jgi:hypothetical protein